MNYFFNSYVRVLLLSGIFVLTMKQAQAASLTATKSSQPASLNLTTEGSMDWSHWGLNASSDWNHKGGVTSQISNITRLGSAVVSRYTDGTMAVSWTGGSPSASASSTRTGVYVAGVNNGFQITVPADATARVLKVYCGVWKSQGKLEASLSDGSAPAILDTTHGSATGSANTLFSIHYAAASSGQNLTVKWSVGTSHDTAGAGTVGWQCATLAAASVDPCAGNSLPTVNLTAPATGATYTAPASVGLAATATDTGGSIARVEFFQGSSLLASDSTSPYGITWAGVAAGSYVLSAKATDNCNAAATSSTVTITVNSSSSSTSSSGSPVTTTLAPVADTYVRDGTYASSNFGSSSVLQTKLGAVDFTRIAYLKFDVASVTGTISSAKLRVYGKYSSTSGATATHAYPVSDDAWAESSLNWNNKPATTSPSQASVLISSQSFQYYEWDITGYVSGEKTAGQTLVSVALKHDASCTGNNDYNSREATANKPQLVIVTNGGTTDPCAGNSAPTVSITSPATGSTYTAPATIAVAASAADSNGTIAKVEFLSGTSLLGSDSTSPYSISWNSVGAGVYSLTARATDNCGATTTSSSVSVTVNSSSSSTTAGGPIDNPVASFYNGAEGYPTWTDNIKWNNVINMATYATGANAFQKFESARDQLYSQGGGVLYYPAGTYDFSDAPADGPNGRGLMLKSGVVIRGVVPATDKVANDGTLDLPTKFVFKFQVKGGGEIPRDWNMIGLAPVSGQTIKDVNNVGIAWVHVVGAYLHFGPEMTWGSTWGSAGGWLSSKSKGSWANRVPNGTHPNDPFAGSPMSSTFTASGKGRLVFGCVFQDSCVLNDFYDPGYGATGFHTYKFTGRVNVYGAEVFVANNVLPKSSKNFKHSQLTSSGVSKTVLFDYGKTMGLDINHDLYGLVKTGFFQEGVVVRDNYVWNHGQKGLNLSGLWGTIRKNHNERTYLKENDDVYGLGTGYELTLDGYRESDGAADNLARAYDIAGKALWIDSNTFNNTGSDPGNDGEGILCQSHGGTELFSWAITRNVHTKGVGEPGYIGGWDVHVHGALISWNTTPGRVGVFPVSTRDGIDAAYVDNQAANGIWAYGTDLITNCPSASPAAPINVTATAAPSHIRVAWTDVSSSEIGYRVERSINQGAWTAIAYRPRRSAGHVNNEQAWQDYTAPKGKSVQYRVVAVNCSDTGGISSTTPAIIR